MELRDLQKMTVVKLREEGMKHSSLVGVNAMSKNELIQALAPIFGIDLEAAAKAARERMAADKTTLKQAIRSAKTERNVALQDQDGSALKKARVGIKKNKRALRRLLRNA